MTRRARLPGQAAFAAWLLLAISIACWPLGASGIGWPATALAILPLLLPLAGIARGRRRAYGWAPLTLAPALALAVTETLVNGAGRVRAAVTLAMILIAFAALVAALRSVSRT